jgi:hypothetical protein
MEDGFITLSVKNGSLQNHRRKKKGKRKKEREFL